MIKQFFDFFIENMSFLMWENVERKSGLPKNAHTHTTGIVQLNFIHHPALTLREYSS
jgi:hypothetical protein